MKFEELGLHPLIAESIAASGFVDCTPIQESSIPIILQGQDLAGLAQTGTGKTAAFLLPLMDRILRSISPDENTVENRPIFKSWLKTNFILVLVPTRELAEQVCSNVLKLSEKTGLTGVAIYGGTSYEPQKKAIQEGVDFIVATPGRLIDLYKEHQVDLNQVRAIVFDEADRMFDMGFKDDMKFILRRVPQDRQFLVFSATLNFDVLNTAYEFGANPVEVNVSRDQAKADNVTDEILHIGQEDKPKFLFSLLQKHKPQQTIIFSNFKHNVERIAKFLSANGIPALGISSLVSQNQRTRVMELFRSQTSDRNVLVATDVAARGLDIKGVDMVINFELPDDAENYVHRIGRTGRAGAKGQAFSLVSDRDVEALQRIESYLENKITIGWMDDADVVRDLKDFPRDESRRKPPSRVEGPQRENRRFEKSSQRRGGAKNSRADGQRGQQKRRQDEQQTNRRPHRDYSGKQNDVHRERSHDQHNYDQRSVQQYNQKPRHESGQKQWQDYKTKPLEHSKNRNGKPQYSRPYKYRPERTGASGAQPRAFAKSATSDVNSAKSGVMAKVSGFFKKLFG